MSLERYLMVKNPLFALKISNQTVYICILFTWIYSSLCIFPQLTLEHGFVLEGLLTSCTFDYLNRDFNTRFFMMMLFICGFFIPMCLIIFFYSFLFLLLRKNSIFLTYNEREKIKSNADTLVYLNRKSSKSGSDYSKTNSVNSNILRNNSDIYVAKTESCSSNKTYNDSFIRRQVKVAKTVVLIIIMFCIAWLPYAVITLIAQYISPNYLIKYINPLTTSLPAIFAKTSSIYNPILYTLSNKDCKNYFRKLFLTKVFKMKQNNGVKKNSEIRLYEKSQKNCHIASL